MTPAPKSLARGGLFFCSTLILEAIFGPSWPGVFWGKDGFGTGGRFMIVGRFFEEQKIDPKVPQKCLGGVWDHCRPVLDQFWTILEQFWTNIA